MFTLTPDSDTPLPFAYVLIIKESHELMAIGQTLPKLFRHLEEHYPNFAEWDEAVVFAFGAGYSLEVPSSYYRLEDGIRAGIPPHYPEFDESDEAQEESANEIWMEQLHELGINA